MQYLKIFLIRKIVLLIWLSFSVFFSVFSSVVSLADNGDEIIQELTNQCESLARAMAQTDRKFPQEPIKNIKGLVTWHAALCGERPKGNGIVTSLCDGHLASGGSIFFWQIKTKTGKLRNGFLTCK